ncbi:SOS response-associated peptidase [Paenibacillus sp. MMS20-IR301]|uniref:SOS response-associated peptidase n=1 Tax=Paenibacillus sp. MMS20-IR301 TaxID=2895946 RepID=UPI0028F14FA0|nr:SOS response-associated peptidase [Paenibacillus sp. MMS20-IR301]WNS43687.1 SOS response-associated peptidase [Paenibacillus sp. MMS20-IR301]
MCGRYTITVTFEELMTRYFIDDPSFDQYAPKFNAAPMQYIPAVIHDGKRNKLGALRWGLLPSWSKEDKNAAKLINARSESLLEKASFKSLVASRRCVIPADGFYDWQVKEDGKHPLRIMLQDGGIFSMAGLYDIWTGPDGAKISTCTIITTAANSLMADIHDRMPVILNRDTEAQWLDRSNRDIPALMKLLQPYDSGQMLAYPVSPAVGNVRNDYRELLHRAGADAV